MKKMGLGLIVLVVFLTGCAGLGGKSANEADKDYISIILIPGKSKDEM